jgi:hypothetical protein
MSKPDIRRHNRARYIGRVVVSWEDTQGVAKYAQAKCLDVSETGMRIETPEPIPAYTNVSLRADQIKLVGAARVKHVVRQGSKYILGLQLSQTLQDRTMSVIRENIE